MKEDNMHKYRIQRNAQNQDILLVPASRHRVIKSCIKKPGGPMSNFAKMSFYIIYCVISRVRECWVDGE